MNPLLRDDVEAYLRTQGVTARPTPLRRGLTLITTPILWSLFAHRWAHARLRRDVSSRLSIVWYASGACLSVINWITNVVNKTELLASVEIDGGIVMSSRGYIILGAHRVGRGTYIGERVTIGMSLNGGGLPEIGENVRIGADSIIYGPLKIGNRAVLLPGTVLTRSIPADVTVQGNPARIVARSTVQARQASTLGVLPPS